MEQYGRVWENMGEYGIIWESMGQYGIILEHEYKLLSGWYDSWTLVRSMFMEHDEINGISLWIMMPKHKHYYESYTYKHISVYICIHDI